ncbi:rab-GTPase-TBC domain-containing protein [Cunninghamella echinulata]|nr:rab-GTPase-TBC domain-containing protein [Cunninghamella echinulata]
MDSLIKEEYSFVNDPRVDNTNSPHAKLLYSKSKVYIHPSANSQDYIPGFLSLVEAKLKKEYLIAWTPEVLIPSHDLEAFVQVGNNPEQENDQVSTVLIPSSGCETSSLYAFSTPITQIHSLVIHPPSFTKWYGSIVINFKDGHSSSPLWFHDDESNSTILQKNTQGGKFFQNNNSDHQKIRWGGDEFMERLSTILSIEISEKDDTLYYVNESISKPKRQSASTSSVFDSIQMDPWVASLKEVRWGILEKFSKVTQFSRNTAQQILNHQTTSSFLPSKYQNNANVRRTMDDYDSARLFLAKWAADLTKHSNQYASDEQRYRNVGLWGHQGGWDEENTDLGIFEILNSENDLSIPTHTRTSPVTMEKWNSFFDKTGKLSIGEPYVLECIFRGGLDPSIRKEAWLFLLNVFEWESTTLEREELIKTKREKYLSLKMKWKEQLSTDNAHLQDQKHRIDKDIHRTDRTTPFYAKDDLPNPDSLMNIGTNANLETLKDILYAYNIYNSELGYVQGMSDLLSPLYAVIGDEALAFWAFVGFMERTKSNFLMDQSGMHQQLLTMDNLLQMMDPNLYKHFQHTDSYNLFFCFRWLLVWFKREFSWNDTLTLWEVFWTNYLTHQFHLFVALAILDQHRDVMIDYLKNFDEILKYINDLALTMDVQEILQRAEILFYQFKQRIEHLDAKKLKEKNQSFPIISPSLRDLLK